jgi:aryl-alcohol dehydrogenase-like predicted oxidoreductase
MKIALGTVQFGLKYGISNIHGKVEQSSVDKILEYACINGINTIDTAMEYGGSERAIGGFSGNDCNWNIVTKTPTFGQKNIENKHIEQLRQSFDNSLLNLNKKRVYGLLIHSCSDLFKHNGELLFRKMEELKTLGFVDKIGVSAYSKQEIDQILDNFEIDLIQVPVSILDQRLINDGSLSKLKNYGVEIHIRSVFLQGLLLMEGKRIPPYFLPIKKNLDILGNIAKTLHLTRLELTLGYVMGIGNVDKIVLGVNSLSQLKEIVNVQPLQNNLDIFKDVSIDNPIYTNPSLWKV